uniref:Uncharacterized protein n=1 Tax=Oryza meridionalis TaxID=40149 RepID=A0A0E0CGB3_9ORYZ
MIDPEPLRLRLRVRACVLRVGLASPAGRRGGSIFRRRGDHATAARAYVSFSTRQIPAARSTRRRRRLRAPTTTRTRIASTGKRGREHLLPKARSIRRRLEKQTGRTDNNKDMHICTYSLVRDVKDATLFLCLNIGHLFVCICRDGFSRRWDEEMDWRHSHRGEGIANPTESPAADMPPGSYAFLMLCRASMFTCGSIGLTQGLLVRANSHP